MTKEFNGSCNDNYKKKQCKIFNVSVVLTFFVVSFLVYVNVEPIVIFNINYISNLY